MEEYHKEHKYARKDKKMTSTVPASNYDRMTQAVRPNTFNPIDFYDAKI